jgi:hypothetical protein
MKLNGYARSERDPNEQVRLAREAIEQVKAHPLDPEACVIEAGLLEAEVNAFHTIAQEQEHACEGLTQVSFVRPEEIDLQELRLQYRYKLSFNLTGEPYERDADLAIRLGNFDKQSEKRQMYIVPNHRIDSEGRRLLYHPESDACIVTSPL